jgi:hypothetical protein
MREQAQQHRYRGAAWQQELVPYRGATWQQEQLLKAVLLEGPASLAAWEQWRTHVDPEQLDYGSHRLLPLLYSTLQRQGISDPQLGRFKGVYRRSWYDNMLRFNAATAVLRAFQDAGIKTMLLKGAALALGYYRDPGLRPMDDFDILVPTPQGPAAVDVLKTLGWAPCVEFAAGTEAEALAAGHAYPFKDAAGRQVDLHWHVFYQRLSPSADEALWTRALPMMFHGVPTHTLNPADQLLHVCVHGTQMLCWWRNDERANLRWIADAMMIFRQAPEEIDWNRLLTLAQRLHYVLPLREALGYLCDVFDAPVPPDVMRRVGRVPVSLGERIAEQARSRPPKHWGPWVALGWRYLEYSSNLSADVGVLGRLAGLPAFFQRRWGQVPLWHLPFVAAWRGLRRVRWAVERHRSRHAST